MQIVTPIPPGKSHGFKKTEILPLTKEPEMQEKSSDSSTLPALQGEIVTIGCSAVSEAVFNSDVDEARARRVIDSMRKVFFEAIYQETLRMLERSR